MEKRKNKGVKNKSVMHLSTKRFSNRHYSMQVAFYEHNMAVADIAYKKRGVVLGYCRVSFDECKVKSMYDYFECLDGLAKDKVARRWFVQCNLSFMYEHGIGSLTMKLPGDPI